MTKEELINLKKSLNIEPREGVFYQAEINLGQFVGSEKTDVLLSSDIEEKSDVEGAIKEIDNTLTEMIIKAAKLGIDIASLKVLINHAFFIDTSYLRLKSFFGEGGPAYSLSLKDIMANYLAIMTSYKIDAYRGYETDIDLLNTTGEMFIVNYEELVNKLNDHGYLEKQIDFNEFFTNKENLNFQIDFEPSLKRIRK